MTGRFPTTKQRRGFTLLEVLIALAILAIAATAVIGQTGSSLTRQADLQDRTIATLLAENQLDLAIAADAFPVTGRSTDTVTFDGREWRVETAVSGTSEPWLRKVEVTVSQGEGDARRSLASLVSYRGKH